MVPHETQHPLFHKHPCHKVHLVNAIASIYALEQLQVIKGPDIFSIIL
jgi:hypothetical protein